MLTNIQFLRGIIHVHQDIIYLFIIYLLLYK